MANPRFLFLIACVASGACSSSSTPQAVGDAGLSDGPSALDGTSAPDAAADAPPTQGEDASGDAATPADGAQKGAWGEPCTVGDDTTCATGLLCLQGPNGGTTGFCTKTCPSTSSTQCSGTPAGTAAFCVVTGVDAMGDKGCAFACKVSGHTWTCPGTLQCETMDDPPGSGQRLCVP